MLPVIRLTYNPEQLKHSSFCQGKLSSEENNINHTVALRRRGNYSLEYDKISYAVKFVDSYGNNVNIKLFNLRKDNYYILDAMAIDKARMRNRVSMELWSQMSPYPWYAQSESEAKNYINGLFVELYVNDEYQGIYCLSERIDRKQLKLEKTAADGNHGILIKANIDEHFDTVYPIDTYSSLWGGYECQYPDVDAMHPLPEWQIFADNISFALNASDQDFNAKAAYYYDLPQMIDYYLFVAVLSALDNMGKNIYYSYYDVKLYQRLNISPWDLDCTFGRLFNGNELDAYDSACLFRYMNNMLFRRIYYTLTDFPRQLEVRYADLRKDVFSKENIFAHFDRYFDLFRQTGAAERETMRWSGVNDLSLDFDYEQEYIKQWVNRHLHFTDSVFHYTDATKSVIEDRSRELLVVATDAEGVIVYSAINQHIRIYSISGILIADKWLKAGSYEQICLPVKRQIYCLQTSNGCKRVFF